MDRPIRPLALASGLALGAACAAAFLMMAHVTADVTLRSLAGRPLPGTAEVVTAWYMVAVACLPWASLERNDAHLRVTAATRLLPARARGAVEVAVRLGLICWIGLFAWQSAAQAAKQTAREEVQQAGAAYLPVWPARWLLPLAAALMAGWVVLALVRSMRRAAPQPHSPDGA